MEIDTGPGKHTTVLFALSVWALLAALMGGYVARPVERDSPAPIALDYRVDLNRADAETLALLPGIGLTIAREIVRSREVEGAFAAPEEIQRVRYVGPRKFARLQAFVECVPVVRREGE